MAVFTTEILGFIFNKNSYLEAKFVQTLKANQSQKLHSSNFIRLKTIF